MIYEQTARNNHKNGMNCAMAVYTALGGEKSNAPKPRAEGGKCGAVLAAEQIIRERDLGDPAKFDNEFLAMFGSLRCADLRGIMRGRCNDHVGTAAMIAGSRLS